MLRELLRGVNALRRGGRLLASVPRLRRLAVFPFLLNLLLFVVGVPLAIWWATGAIGGLVPEASGWLAPIRFLLQLFVGLIVAVSALFVFTAIGSAIAAPFNARLSEAIEEHLRAQGKAIKAPAKRDTGGTVVLTIFTALGRLLVFLVLYPPIWGTQFLPVVGPIVFSVLAVLYGSFVLSFDFSDPTLERHIDGFRAKVRYLMAHKSRYLGFGAGALAMMIVPVLNLLLMPICVAAGALLYLEEDR